MTALLLCALGAFAAAPAASEEPNTVLMVAVPSSGGTDARLAGIVLDSVALELECGGMCVLWLEPSGADPATILADDGSVMIEALLSLAREAAAARVSVVRHAVVKGAVYLELACYDGSDGARMGMVTIDGKVESGLDELVAAGVRSLLEQIKACEAAAEPTDLALQEPAEPAVAQAQEPALWDTAQTETPLEVPPAQPVGTAAPSAPAHDAEISPLPAVAGQAQAAPRVTRLQLGVGMAPFLTTGPASEYFTLGLAESFWVRYRLPMFSDHLAVGIRVGAYGFDAQGAVASSRNTLVPIGLEAALHADDQSLFTAYVSVAGGPAIFTVNPNGMGSLSKILFHLHLGLGLSVMFLDRVGAGIEAAYAMSFEKYLPITGFVPSLYVLMRR